MKYTNYECRCMHNSLSDGFILCRISDLIFRRHSESTVDYFAHYSIKYFVDSVKISLCNGFWFRNAENYSVSVKDCCVLISGVFYVIVSDVLIF